MNYYLVAPTVLARIDEEAFTYHSPQPLPIGSIVRISVGKKATNGVIIKKVARPAFTTKPIEHVLTEKPLPEPLVQLAFWLKDYYVSHLSAALQTILPSGVHKKRRAARALPTHAIRHRTKIVFNKQQRAVLQQAAEHKNQTLLLHGVTGSGKTQIYIELAKQQLALGNSSIILVPEIALTPQLVAEFTNHFDHIIVTHSGMSEAERHHAWLECLQATKPVIVIGPRSALFMPLINLGLIVLDECHEPSYKQDQSPKYLALRAATILARLHKQATVVLGSATPSVTDYYIAKQKNIPILTLSKPALATVPPQTTLIDIKKRDNFREHHVISDSLLAAIRQALADNQQVMLFHNRRGTAPSSLCTNCGWLATCPHCFISLTLHADKHQLLCHICGFSAQVPPNCPDCHHPDITFKGVGTKLIESELHKLFPKATIARFDADNATDETLQARYQELYDGTIDIMVGTQLLAKGLDLPNLRVVGVIQADSGLSLPDYQAEERVFQLLFQVAGRVGRGDHQSTVVIQTYLPDHPTIQLALERNYDQFYEQQRRERQKAPFPPFVYLLKLTCAYKTEVTAVQAAKRLATAIRQQHPNVQVLGPTPAFYERLGGKYRWQLLVKSKQRQQLVQITKKLPPIWQADLDPASLL